MHGPEAKKQRVDSFEVVESRIFDFKPEGGHHHNFHIRIDICSNQPQRIILFCVEKFIVFNSFKGVFDVNSMSDSVKLIQFGFINGEHGGSVLDKMPSGRPRSACNALNEERIRMQLLLAWKESVVKHATVLNLKSRV